MAEHSASVADLVEWLRGRPRCIVEDGLNPGEIHRAEEHFGIEFPPLWRAVLAHIHPISVPEPARSGDGVLRWTAYPDWRRRDEAATRELIARPVDGLLFDVAHNGFWWTAWGTRPDDTATRLARAADRLATVPRLVPLWGRLHVASTDDSPVFSIVQADMYVPALTIADLPAGRGQQVVPPDGWPIGDVPFWSELHAYTQRGTDGPFADLATGDQ